MEAKQVSITANDGKTILHGDVFELIGGALKPVILFFHGGGWAAGFRSENTKTAQDWARAGFKAITCDYRLDNPINFLPGQTEPAYFPLEWNDTADWVMFARTLPGANGKVLVWGGSAGATNGVMCALAGTPGQDKADVVISMSAAYDFSDPTSLLDDTKPLQFYTGVVNYCHCSPLTDHACLRSKSPIAFISKDASPMFLVQGELDTMPHGQLGIMTKALDAIGFKDYKAVVVPNGIHAQNNWLRPGPDGVIIRDAAIAFAKAHI